MPVSFWIAIILGIIGLFALIVTGLSEEKGGPGLVAGVCIVLAIIFTVGASANQVPARNVGVVQSFGKPTGEVTGPGLKFVAPWKKVIDWDASIQTSNHDAKDRCVTVRIGNGTMGCVETQVRYEVIDTAAPAQVTANKGDFEKFKNDFFERQLASAVQEVFESYDPLAQIDTKTGVYTFKSAEKAEAVKAALTKNVGKDIRILSVLTPKTWHDQKTEDNMQAFQAEIARNRVLVQAGINAAQEKANAEILKALPQVYLEKLCLEIADEKGKEPGLCLSGNVQSVRPIN